MSKSCIVFVVQKHKATRLHYDFRLQIGPALKSWAVPKGPSIDPSVKRLAIMVEDHPIEYKDFEGVIPNGYGAGTVMVWDFGDYTLLEGSIQEGRLRFYLDGKKLKGVFSLTRTRWRENSWLLVKEYDAFDQVDRRGYDITKEQPNSAKTGLTLEEIGKGSGKE